MCIRDSFQANLELLRRMRAERAAPAPENTRQLDEAVAP